MLFTGKQSETDTIIQVAKAMCTAIRTAPKTKGEDFLECCVLTGDDLEKLIVHMEEKSKEPNCQFFARDAGNLRNSTAVVLAGAYNAQRGLNEKCQFCGFENCAACKTAGGACAFTGIDLGIALGSATSIAADNRIDNRIMFSAGRCAMDLGFLPEDCTQVFAIPLSASGKSIFFDR